MGCQRFDGVEECELCVRAMYHRGGDGLAEGCHRARRKSFEHPIQGQDLIPVRVLRARRLGMQRRNGRLHLIGAEREAGEAVGDESDAFVDCGVVPA